ncbi:VanW family protein [[Bacillus] enclensis]|uniref:VanW family protein n=1 Tax=[Bacillus] enclensis TaxID=1402860 RepID=UPI0018DD1206|nr:VanW family protein [[Bacillus] enclensis]MBH9967084.1 VanW family protein [[Bacillus] enclensis]
MKKTTYAASFFLVLCTVYLFGTAHLGSFLYDLAADSKNVTASTPELAGKTVSGEREGTTDSKDAAMSVKETYPRVVLAESTIENIKVTPGLEEFLSSFSEIEIEPVSSFSLLKFGEDEHLDSMTDEEMSVVSTGLYEVLLYSGLEIVQRHHGRSLPDYAELGFEARVDKELHQDFKFANPDSSSYIISFKMEGNSLRFVLEGPQLPKEVEITLQDKQSVEPRVIRQYTPYVKRGQTKVKVEGEKGIKVDVWKTTLDSKGAVLKEELISSDYYPPVHREELVSLEEYMDSRVADGTQEGSAVSPDGNETQDTSRMADDGTEAPDASQQNRSQSGGAEESRGDQTDSGEHDNAESRLSPAEDIPDPNMK